RGYRLMSRACGPEPVARRAEPVVPLLLQQLHHRLLDEAVEHRWNAERTGAAGRLRDVDTPHRLWLVGALEQLDAKVGPVVFQMQRQGLTTPAIQHPRAPAL